MEQDTLQSAVALITDNSWASMCPVLLGAVVAVAIVVTIIALGRRSSESAIEGLADVNVSDARKASHLRALAIEHFLVTGRAPEPPVVSYASDDHSHEAILTAIISYQSVEHKLPEAEEFIEVPPPLVDFVALARTQPAKAPVPPGHDKPGPRKVQGLPNVVGQRVRLERELAGPLIRGINVSLLLGRVVDAAILVDEYFARHQEFKHEDVPPFFDRIYVERIDGIRGCFRRVAGRFPARVVIETPYPSLFFNVLTGGAAKKDKITKALASYFGIEVRVRSSKRRSHKLVPPDGAERQTRCRAVRSRHAGVLQGPVTIAGAEPAPLPILVELAPAGIIDPKCKSAQKAERKGTIDQWPNVMVIWRPPPGVHRGPTNEGLNKFCIAKGACPFRPAKPVATLRLDEPEDGRERRALYLKGDRRPVVPVHELGAWWDERIRKTIRFPATLCKRKPSLLRGSKDRFDAAGYFLFRGRREDKRIDAIVLSSSGSEEAPHTVVDAGVLRQYLLGVWFSGEHDDGGDHGKHEAH